MNEIGSSLNLLDSGIETFAMNRRLVILCFLLSFVLPVSRLCFAAADEKAFFLCTFQSSLAKPCQPVGGVWRVQQGCLQQVSGFDDPSGGNSCRASIGGRSGRIGKYLAGIRRPCGQRHGSLLSRLQSRPGQVRQGVRQEACGLIACSLAAGASAVS